LGECRPAGSMRGLGFSTGTAEAHSEVIPRAIHVLSRHLTTPVSRGTVPMWDKPLTCGWTKTPAKGPGVFSAVSIPSVLME
jgi:hypothetical protein